MYRILRDKNPLFATTLVWQLRRVGSIHGVFSISRTESVAKKNKHF